jgi:hypothetical protein
MTQQIELSTSPWPGMPDKGWLGKFDLPKPAPGFLESFDRLAFDTYAPNAQRFRRFSQYIAFFDCKAELTLERLPHRPFVQSAKYNSYSGGIPRKFEPIEPRIDVKPYINQLFELLDIERSLRYHIDVHQYRVYGKPEAAGTSVPEGPHSDGMECVAILVFQRQGITPRSAEFSLIDPQTKKPFFSTVVGAGEGILLDDQKMLHDAAPIAAAGSEQGFRDYIVVNINQIENRRYGRAHELISMSPEAAEEEKRGWKEIKTRRLIRTANVAFKDLQNLIKAKNPRALGVVHKIEQKAGSLGGYDALDFKEGALLEAKKLAVAISANNQMRKAKDGRDKYRALHTVHRRLEQLKVLKGGTKPNRSDGLDFDGRTIKRVARRPNLWRLQAAAQTAEQRRQLDIRYPRDMVCL